MDSRSILSLFFYVLAILLVLATRTTAGAFPAALEKSILQKTKISGEFRNLFFQRNFTDNTVDCEDLAVGGKIRFETGDIRRFSVGFSFYTAQGMGLNDDDNDVYGLLAKDSNGNHKSYAALGEAYLLAEFNDTTVKIGRQEMYTPWINYHDIRTTPQSFEAVTLNNTGISGLQIVLSHVNRIKKRTETTFQSMSLAAGAAQEEPVTAGGMIFTGIEGIKLQVWDYYAHHMWNDVYVRADCTVKMKNGVCLFANARNLKRDDTGDGAIGSIDTYMFGLQGGLEIHGAKFSLAYGQNGRQPVLRPWGHDLAVSIQVHVADRAEETAWNPGFTYDFSRIGLEGLVGGVTYAVFDAPDSGPNASPDRDEINFNVLYDCSRWISGLSLQLRYAIIDEDETLGGEDFNDLRFCLRYLFDFHPFQESL